jgi:Ni/Co efflux regulator RcnB
MASHVANHAAHHTTARANLHTTNACTTRACGNGNAAPDQYQQPQHVVTDWHRDRLSPPPPGHHWVRAGDDFVLVAIATGVILQLILTH